jgi:GTPase SAR1 family protein
MVALLLEEAEVTEAVHLLQEQEDLEDIKVTTLEADHHLVELHEVEVMHLALFVAAVQEDTKVALELEAATREVLKVEDQEDLVEEVAEADDVLPARESM